MGVEPDLRRDGVEKFAAAWQPQRINVVQQLPADAKALDQTTHSTDKPCKQARCMYLVDIAGTVQIRIIDESLPPKKDQINNSHLNCPLEQHNYPTVVLGFSK